MWFLNFLKQWSALLIALASLVVAIISLVRSSKSQKLQDKVNGHDLAIKEYELAKIKIEQENAQLSCVKAYVVHPAKNKYSLKIKNTGNTIVYNVSAFIDTASRITIYNSKMPYKELEPQEVFEQKILVTLASAPVFNITTSWTDSNGKTQERTQQGSI